QGALRAFGSLGARVGRGSCTGRPGARMVAGPGQGDGDAVFSLQIQVISGLNDQRARDRVERREEDPTMLRPTNLAGALILSAFMALLLLAIGAPATSGAISGGQSTMPSSMAPPIPSPVDCAQAPTDFQVLVLDLADGGVCRAVSTEGTTP